MKKNYYLFTVLALVCANLLQAQCPESIGPQSTTTEVHFKIISGNCGIYPATITINAINFNKTTCNGTNLKYATSGPPLASADTFSAFFDVPGVGICQYVNGVLQSLSSNDVTLNEAVSIYPNPLIKEKELTLKFSRNLSAKILMYDVSGKLTVRDEVNSTKFIKINTQALNNGIYFLQIVTDEASITRKVIIMN